MKQGFRFDLYDWVNSLDYAEYDDYMKAGEKLKRNVPNITEETILRYKKANGHISADDIMDELFPDQKADVFLSHSHKDIDVATVFAGYLSYEFGVKPFIDSFVWADAYELLHTISELYSKKGKDLYDYHGVVISAAQIYTILNGELIKMMDKTENYILLVSPESMQEDTTSSPWIYSEILYSQILCPFHSINEAFFANTEIDYPAYTAHLQDLPVNEIEDRLC